MANRDLIQLRWGTALLIALVLLIFGWFGLRSTFVYDDHEFVMRNPGVTQSSFTQIFTEHYPAHHPDQGLYRPLITLSYKIDAALFGLPAQPHLTATFFHTTNIIVHAIVVLLLVLLLRRLYPELATLPLLICAGLFAFHPLATESVCWVSGRAELFAGLFLLVCLNVFIYFRVSGSRPLLYSAAFLIAFVLALLSKESSIVLPGLIVIFELVYFSKIDRRRFYLFFGIACVLAAIYMIVRISLTGRLGPDIQAYTGITTSFGRVIVAGKVMLQYILMLLFPTGLSIFHDVQVNFWPSLIASILVVGITVLCVILGRKQKGFWLAAGWFWIALLPVSNLVFPIGSVMAERFLYVCLIGLALSVAWILKTLNASMKVVGLLGIWVLMLSGQTFLRTADWQNEITLWRSATQVYPDSFVTHMKSGDAALLMSRKSEALDSYQTALLKLEKQPLMYQEKFRPAIQTAMKSLEDPTSEEEILNLEAIHALARAGKFDRAAALYAAYLELKPKDVSARKGIIDCLIRLDLFKEAQPYLKAILVEYPKDGLLHAKLALCFSQTGKPDLARVHYKRALEINPQDGITWANLAILEMREEKFSEAKGYLEKAIQIQPRAQEFRYNLAVCYVQLGRKEEAAEQARIILKENPNHRGARKLLEFVLGKKK